MTAIELRAKRAGLVQGAREILNTARADGNRDLTAEEEQTYDRTMAEVDTLRSKIDRLEKLAAIESELDRPGERQSEDLTAEQRHANGDGASAADAPKRQRAAYRHWLRTGEVRQELRPLQAQAMAPEYRDTIISTDAKGGYLITPTQISADIVSLIEDLVFIRGLCQAAGAITTVTEAKKLGIRKKTAHMADADWTTEVASVTEDTTMAFGLRELEPQLASKLAKISIRTLMLSADAENLVRDELGYKFGITEEKAFLTGDGAGKPLGIYTASASGISTARDVTAAAATSFTADNLIDMKYSLKQGYRSDKSCAWIVSREFVKQARKLKVASTTGGNDLEYIWQPGLTGGQPDRILDIPYSESEYAPNTFTTGLYVAVLGCFRYYRIAQLADVMIQRLVERYADTNEVGFIGRRWVDGAPVNEEAFSRLKLA